MRKIKIALLIGSGSRVPAILECVGGIDNAKVVFVISSKGEGMGTSAARSCGIRAEVLRLKDFGKGEEGRERLSAVVCAILRERKVDLIVMAGWMVLVPKVFVDEFRGRAINIHPSILPAYPGKGEDVIPAQWNDKAVPAGCALHYIDEGMDTGKVVLKGYVVRKSKDYKMFKTLDDFAAAIHKKEDEVLCKGVKKLVSGRRRQ